MPKRERALILSPHKALVHFSQWSLGKWKQPTSALQIDLTAPPLNDSSDAASAMRPATPLTKAMRTRRMSNLAHIADLNLAFERQASFVDRAVEIVKSLPPPQSGPNPAALPPPYVVGPQSRCKHVASIIVLHGPLHEDGAGARVQRGHVAGAMAGARRAPSLLLAAPPRCGAHRRRLAVVVTPPPRPHFALAGFTCHGEMLAGELIPPLRRQLRARGYGAAAFGGLRLVFLTAPRRSVSCYVDESQSVVHAWHDYFTDHGGAEARPDIEETIDAGQLEWSAAQVHLAMESEARLLGNDMGRVGVVGQSQGACTALHSVLTHAEHVAGVFCSIGQLYSLTPVRAEKRALPVYTFNGAADDCIAPSLSLRTYSRLLDGGFRHVRMHLEPHATHEGSTAAEVALLCEALETWGLLRPPPPSRKRA